MRAVVCPVRHSGRKKTALILQPAPFLQQLYVLFSLGFDDFGNFHVALDEL